jgi:coproporphyrinogen III oxidase-like Fe-S oxidoreductase
MDPRGLMKAIDTALSDRPAGPLAIYVHIPFCASKCHFCDWVTDVPVARLRSGANARRGYVEALVQQIRCYGPLLTRMGYQPAVMYWGGGTPTRLAPEEMRLIGAALDDSFDLSELQQWSMETTPNDLAPDKLATMRSMGVDRVSVGAQSFNPYQLRRSGRAHTGEQTEHAVAMVRDAGITTFNIDLICGFPGEDEAAFLASLERALRLDPPHVSVYPYRATPATVMAMQLERSVLQAQGRSHVLGAYEAAMAVLRREGYHEYCHGYWVRRPEDEDKDGNHKYDLAGDKIGFGSGAESIIGHHLLWNENSKYAEYLERPRDFTFAHRFSLREPGRLTAPVGGALMTRQGVVYERFSQLTGLSFEDVRATAYFRDWFAVLEECGARFIETDSSLRMDPAVIHTAYINHLVYTTSAGLDVARA